MLVFRRKWDHFPKSSRGPKAATHMPIRIRKLIGAVALIVLCLTWALLAMAFAQFPTIKASGLVEVIYYVVAGLGWVLPAMPLVRWMLRPEAKPR
jgi:hypothetical protein